VREAAAAVLVGPARCLHHAIERQVVEHNDPAHVMVLSVACACHPRSPHGESAHALLLVVFHEPTSVVVQDVCS
jgi:hypothetical protein